MEQDIVNPLELVTTEDLIHELFRRYPSAAFVGQREGGENDLLERLEMQGQERIVQGLLFSLMLRCDTNLASRTGPSDY